MFKKPVWDDLSLWHGALSCWKYIRRWYTVVIKRWTCCSRNRDSSDQATFFQSSIVQFWWVCVNCILNAVLIWPERHPVWSSAAGVHLFQGSTCCVFRDGILHTLVVTSGYLSYCCLSIISNQSVHSPLTSDINKAFSSTQLPLTGYFLLLGSFSVNPRDGCVWKSQ